MAKKSEKGTYKDAKAFDDIKRSIYKDKNLYSDVIREMKKRNSFKTKKIRNALKLDESYSGVIGGIIRSLHEKGQIEPCGSKGAKRWRWVVPPEEVKE